MTAVIDAAIDAARPREMSRVDTNDTAVDVDTGHDVGEERAWRSVLYPADWTPTVGGPDGMYLPDFSYAGYRGGEDLPAVESVEFDVNGFGADPTGSQDSRTAFQSAIDAASINGGIVIVPEGLYRIDDSLEINASDVIIRGGGPSRSRLWFTRSSGMTGRSHITFRGSVTTVTESMLREDADARQFSLHVENPADFAVGDDVTIGWNISDAFVAEHQMVGVWTAFNGTWQPFFRRTVTQVADDVIRVDVPIRYPTLTRDDAAVRRVTGYVTQVGVEDLGVADATTWDAAWSERQVHVIEFDGVKDGWIRGVASFPSPGAPIEGPGAQFHLQNGGIIVRRSKRVTVADSQLALAQNRGSGGCGYLFEVRQSSEVLFRDLVATGGRHNFIQNWGFGTSGVVWLRVHSAEGKIVPVADEPIGTVGDSEFHHSLAMANLVDSSHFDDGFAAFNRKDESTGAGHTATRSVFWNTRGSGRLRSYQYGHGYVIGTSPELSVLTDLPTDDPDLRRELEPLGPWTATAPYDWIEGASQGTLLEPQSLYEDQRLRRLSR